VSEELLIREAEPSEYALLGDLTVSAYASLEGMPDLEQGRGYYEDLRNVAGRAQVAGNRILVACDAESGELLGGVTLMLAGYGPASWGLTDAAGIRVLAVALAARSRGAGRALFQACLREARRAGKKTVGLHTTAAMPVARAMYERAGFRRVPSMDFDLSGMLVQGFRLDFD
jgi:GNAT superfamily N-acetyltransferase